MERNWKRLEWIGELAVLLGYGSDARSREECQADGTADVLYMVFVLKTGKYGLKMIFYMKIVGEIGKILKDINKCLNRC